MIEKKHLELLQFDKIKSLISQKCHSKQAKLLADGIYPVSELHEILAELNQTNELKLLVGANAFFPGTRHHDIWEEVGLLALEGVLLSGPRLLNVMGTVGVSNSLTRFLKSKKTTLPFLHEVVKDIEVFQPVVDEIEKVIDHEGQVKNGASAELNRIRRQVSEKRKESDKRFYHYINELRKHGFLRENEEGYFNGRRTLAVLVEHKTEVPGFVHGKSESGKTIFIEPGATIGINNEVAELEIDEQREINRILRALCVTLSPYAKGLKKALKFLIYIEFLEAKALFAIELDAHLPEIKAGFDLKVVGAVHPILFLQNKRAGKKTIPLNLQLNSAKRIVVISGPNAGGKTIALKTIGLLQLMLQSGLLIPVKENSTYCFFEKVLIDIGDTQSIENELSTYSAKLKSMTSILEEVSESTLVLMDEFGSGTDPMLGSAIAEAVLENLVTSKSRGIITSHFGNVKLLAGKLDGAINASMLFNIETLEPKYILSVGEPGSSYTFEVAEHIGFPKHLIERAKQKVDKDHLQLGTLLADVQHQKVLLEEQFHRSEHEEFLKKIAKEKYLVLFNKLEEKLNIERDKRIELARLADYGQKYLRLMDEYNHKKDKKEVVKKFMEGITAESKKKELLRKQKKVDAFAGEKIARIKPNLKVGSRVKILKGSEIGIVEKIVDEKVFINFGLMKMTVGMENLVLAD